MDSLDNRFLAKKCPIGSACFLKDRGLQIGLPTWVTIYMSKTGPCQFTPTSGLSESVGIGVIA
jgi:hypothetical protein